MANTPPRPADAYDAWAPVYDRTFGALVEGARRRAIEKLDLRPGQRVLDLGIGTGAAMDAIPGDTRVVGVDLSASMLSKAARRLGSEPARTQRHLVQADAQLPPFGDGVFDHVLLTHVISVVDEPATVMRRVARMVKPTGSVLIVNHFRDPDSPLSGVKRLLNPLCVRIGWRSDLTLAECLDGAALAIDRVERRSPLSLWQAVRLRPIPQTDDAHAADRSDAWAVASPAEHTDRPAEAMPTR
ncbi:MAG: methyltransferase domain-containing protein [Planctomycetota bacterium]